MLESDCPAPGKSPKKLSDALLEIASSGATAHPFLANVSIAQAVNRAHGGALVSAWDVDEFDTETIEACMALLNDLPRAQEAEKQAQTRRLAWLHSHGTYGKFGLLVRH